MLSHEQIKPNSHVSLSILMMYQNTIPSPIQQLRDLKALTKQLKLNCCALKTYRLLYGKLLVPAAQVMMSQPGSISEFQHDPHLDTAS
jgi:hypothetical protein